MAYPERLLSPDEEVVMEFRPHWSRIFKELVLSVAVVIVLVLLAVLFDFPNRGWVMLAIAAIWLVLVVRGFLSWWFTQHVITNERLIYRAGITSRSGKEIPLEVINDVSFSQTPWERIIKSGDLLIESAGEQGQSHYRDIPTPEDMQRVIYGVREDRMLHIQRGGTSSPITKAQQLEILSRLHDEGKLSDEEFEAEKRSLNAGDT
jgi:membrane protein YdbS with pleckstrin-like domain